MVENTADQSQQEFESWYSNELTSRGFDVESLYSYEYAERAEGLAFFDVTSAYRGNYRESVAAPGKMVPNYSEI